MRAAPFALLAFSLSACTSATISFTPADYGGGSEGTSAEGANYITEDPNAVPELAVVGDNLYWVDRGDSIADSIQFAPSDGGPTSQFYTVAGGSNPTAAIEDLASDGKALCWTEVVMNGGNSQSWVKTMALGGSQAKVLATGAGPYGGLTVAGGYVYFVDGFGAGSSGISGTSLSRVSISGGQVESLDEGNVTALASGGAGVFFIAGTGKVQDLSTVDASGKVEVLAEAEGSVLAANGQEAFWLSSSPDGNDGFVCADTPGHKAEVLTGVTDDAVAIAADGASVYYFTTDGSIEELPIGQDQEPIVLASGYAPPSTLVMAHALAQDSANVYFLSGGSLYSTSK